jgi:hypothetical protein
MAAIDNEQTMAETVRFEVRIVNADMNILPFYDMHNRKSRELYQLRRKMSIRQI